MEILEVRVQRDYDFMGARKLVVELKSWICCAPGNARFVLVLDRQLWPDDGFYPLPSWSFSQRLSQVSQVSDL